MKPTRQMIVDYAQVLNDYNLAHMKEYDFIPFCTKAHNPYMDSGKDKTLNELMSFETKLSKKFQFSVVRMMKTEAINILRTKD